MIVELTLLPLAVICVMLRLWIRIGWLHRSGWDDWIMLAGVVSNHHVDPYQHSILITEYRYSPLAPLCWSYWPRKIMDGTSTSGT